MNKEKQNKYYFEGRCFECYESFLLYIKNWKNHKLSQDIADTMFQRLKIDLLFNIYLRDIVFTNQEFNDFLEQIFAFAMKSLLEHQNKEKK